MKWKWAICKYALLTVRFNHLPMKLVSLADGHDSTTDDIVKV